MTLRNVRVEPSAVEGNWTQIRESVDGVDRCVALFENREDADLFATMLLTLAISQALTPEQHRQLLDYRAATITNLVC